MSNPTLTIPHATPCWSSAYGDNVLFVDDGRILGVFGEDLYPAMVSDAIEVSWAEVQFLVIEWAHALGARAA